MEGWVKLHRKLLEATIFQNPNLLKFWIWCLLKASHKEHNERVGLQEITLNSGQFVFGRNKAAMELNMTPSTVYKYLRIMEKEQLIRIKSSNKFSVVTIVKWEVYQSDDKNRDNKGTTIVTTKEQQSDSRVTPKEQQSNTNKNEKNVKNEKNKYTCAFDDFWKSYPRKVDKGNAYKKFQARVNEGYAERELITACENYAAECRKNKTEARFIKHASTFLSSTRPFLDYLPKKGEGKNDADGQNTADDLVKKGIDLGIGDDFDGF